MAVLRFARSAKAIVILIGLLFGSSLADDAEDKRLSDIKDREQQNILDEEECTLQFSSSESIQLKELMKKNPPDYHYSVDD